MKKLIYGYNFMNHSNNALVEPPLWNGLFIFILKKPFHLELS